MVAVGDIALVRHARNNAKTALQALGELIRRRLQRRAVQREIDVAFGLPLGAFVVHVLHDGHGKRRAFLLGVAVARHVLDALIQTGIPQADGGIAAHEQFVDRLALLKARQGAVLPQNRCGIRKRAHQALMTAQQGTMAQLKALVEDLPELVHVLMRAQCDIGQVDGHNTLVKAAIVLRFGRVIVQRVGNIVKAVARTVGRQEAAATHAGVAIAIAGGLTLRQLELTHLLLRDVVGHHALGGALGSQLGQVEVRGILVNVIVLEYIDKLGECRGNPHAGLVLNALVALAKRLLHDHGKVVLLLRRTGLVKIHKDRHERRLAIRGHKRHDLILNRLDAATDLVTQTVLNDLTDLLGRRRDAKLLKLAGNLDTNLLAAHLDKRSQVGQRNRLTAVLGRGDLGDNLRRDIASSREAVRLLDQRARDNGAVLEHILQVHQVTVMHVLGEVVRIMEVNQALVVGIHDLLGQQHALRQVLGNLAGHVVALNGVDGRVLIGVLLLDLFVVALDERQNFVVSRVLLALQALNIAIDDVVASDLVAVETHNLVLDQILDLLDRYGVTRVLACLGDVLRRIDHLAVGKTRALLDLQVGGANRIDNLIDVKDNLGAAALDNLHPLASFTS